MEGPLAGGFECQCEGWFRSACKGLPFYDEYEGEQYCVLHYPSKEKTADPQFQEALQKKKQEKNYDFSGVYFPLSHEGYSRYFEEFVFESPALFSGATFSDSVVFYDATFSERADFNGATFCGWVGFNGATFCKEAGFARADFRMDSYSAYTGFSEATFCERADFHQATFHERANFDRATFYERANFSRVDFGTRADFQEATFRGWVDFSGATFGEEMDFVRAFFGDAAYFLALKTFPEKHLLFIGATMERPERISFHRMHLRVSWFVDVVDAQKFDFSDVEWFQLPDGKELTLEDETKVLAEWYGPEETSIILRKLQKACRRLMSNAEENRDYPTANELHYWSMEAQRKESWSRLGLIATLYWALSGYGERPRRAFLVLVGMWVLFAILYMACSHPNLELAADLGLWQSVEHVGQTLVYSLATIARLNPEPRPEEPGLFQFLVTAEGILGPLQIALFALAVRRKVMR